MNNCLSLVKLLKFVTLSSMFFKVCTLDCEAVAYVIYLLFSSSQFQPRNGNLVEF